MAEITIEGLEELLDDLEEILPAIKTGLSAGALYLKGKAAEYPPSTAGNQPKNYVPGRWNTWYQRGFGSKWARADGTVGSRATSETLGRKWTSRGQTGSKGLAWVVGNNVSYSKWVQGDEQTWFHKAHGWKSTETLKREEEDEVRKRVNEIIEKKIAEINRS